MSSFFTTPASQRKRKRPSDGPPNASAPKRRSAAERGGARGAPPRNKQRPSNQPPADEDEDISGSDSGSDGPRRRPDEDEDDDDAGASTSDSDHDDETAAERRLRLAERYLENIRGEVEDEVGFDAEEIDRDLIAERLKEDVAETKGRMYRHIADEIDITAATHIQFRADTQSTTSIACHPPYVYTVSKDMTLIKWEIPNPQPPQTSTTTSKSTRPPHPPRRRPRQLLFTRGSSKSSTTTPAHHTSPILALAVSPSGEYLVTGSHDARLIIWSTTSLQPLKSFSQHRSAVTSLAFRRNTNQLYSASADRTIKLWSLDELAYVETLFGHQDAILDVAALATERCVSVGGRDRTARLWKVVEETQLVFRGGGLPSARHRPTASSGPAVAHAEGSIDRIAMVDEETFLTGSDNGSLCLWTMHKKKPVFTLPLAHGLAPPPSPTEASAETHPADGVGGEPQPRWITALAAVPYADLFVSGSWDGCVRVWRVSADKRRIEAVGELEGARGVVNDLALFVRGGEHKNEGVCVVAGTGKEHRLGRWLKVSEGRNGAVVWEIPARTKARENGAEANGVEVAGDGTVESNGVVSEA